MAQETGRQIRPEFDLYVQLEPRIRIEYVNIYRADLNTDQLLTSFTLFVEMAFKPVIRRTLRMQPNVYRNRYLTFRGGYQYRTELTGEDLSEKRGIIEVTPQYFLPWRLEISDRNRGEFRWFKGEPFSARYRNRFRLARDVEHGQFECTLYAYAEVFYEPRYELWTPTQYALGMQFPINPHFMLEAYYQRRHFNISSSPDVNSVGLKFNLYY